MYICFKAKSLIHNATTLSITNFGIATLSIMTLSITNFGIATLSIMTLSIMTLSITTFRITINKA